MSKNYVHQCTSENGLEMRIYGEILSEQEANAIPEPIYDWDDEPTVEIPVQTMRDVVYGDTQPVPVMDCVVPGHTPVGPERPTRDMRPLGRGRKAFR